MKFMVERKSHKIGLVLSGGGAKGAYQIGVWKALEDLGIAQNISIFSGTSAGALNAVILAQGDTRLAEEIWNEISSKDILQVQPMKFIPLILSLFGGNRGSVSLSLLKELLSSGVFSRKELSRLIERYVNPEKIKSRNKKVYVACTKVSMPPRAKYFPIHKCPLQRTKKILLASSAIPGVFGKEEIDNSEYYDGGLTDYIPIFPVYSEGCDVIISVFLSRNYFTTTMIGKAFRYEDYPRANFVNISPDRDLGSFVKGVFSFKNSQEKIEKRYMDTKKAIDLVYDQAKAKFIEEKFLSL